MKTEIVIKYLGGRGAKLKLAKLFGISRAAITRWGDTIPARRTKVLLERYPALADSMHEPIIEKHEKKG